MAAHQAPPSLGFSRQEHWSGLPFPSPMHESEKWKWSRSVVSNSSQPHGLQPTRLLYPWDFPGKSTGVGCHRLFQWSTGEPQKQYAKWKKPVIRAFLVAQWYRIHLPKQAPQVRSLGQEDPLEKGMATHSSILAWKITWTEGPGRL